MRKIITVILVLVAIIGILFIVKHDDETRFSKNNPSGINGKVVEMIDENRILVEVTGRHDGFDEGDKTIVQFNRSLWTNYDDMGELVPAKVCVGDTVSVQFWGENVSQGDEYEVISVDNIEIYKDKDEDYKELSKEHPNYISGEVIRINDDNTVTVDVTRERGGYKIGDKILINYSHALHLSYISEEDEKKEKELLIGDIVSVEVEYDEVNHSGDMDIITISDIYIDNCHFERPVKYKNNDDDEN